MSFVVETGTGSSTATSYATVDQYKQYWANRGTTISDTTATIQGRLNAATEYIDISFTFRGEKYTDDQALEWPRYGIVDYAGNVEIDDCIIPQKLIDATCYLAAQIANGALIPVDEGIRSETFGPVSKTYSGQKSFPMADKLLRQLIVSGNTMVRVN